MAFCEYSPLKSVNLVSMAQTLLESKIHFRGPHFNWNNHVEMRTVLYLSKRRSGLSPFRKIEQLYNLSLVINFWKKRYLFYCVLVLTAGHNGISSRTEPYFIPSTSLVLKFYGWRGIPACITCVFEQPPFEFSNATLEVL